MKRTKIVCTLGPASTELSVIKEMIKAGMNVARLNLSHGSYSEHSERMDTVRKASGDLDITVGLLLDLQGPKIRIGEVKGGSIELKEGTSLKLVTDDIVGDEDKLFVKYPYLYRDLKPGDAVMLDDGLLELRVEKVSAEGVECKVVTGGLLKNRKGVNFRGVRVDVPTLTQKDIDDINFGVEQNADMFAVSFARNADDINAVRGVLEKLGSDASLIAKIENMQGFENLDSILEVADGIMIARGDLGIEALPEDVPIMQKKIMEKCHEAGKPVITATQMLDSMKQNPLPTRAEVTDVSNAIGQGSDAVMLSGETAVGAHPILVVKMMARIAVRTEQELAYEQMLRDRLVKVCESVEDAICHSTCVTAEKLDLAAIVSSTQSGSTARNIAKYRPRSPIIATTPYEKVARRLTMVWGVIPVVVGYFEDTDSMVMSSVKGALDKRLVREGDLIAITGGIGPNRPGRTNFVRVHRV